MSNIIDNQVNINDDATNTNCNDETCPKKRFESAMSLINDLSRSSGIKQEYQLLHYDGPCHNRIYQVSLQLGSLGYFSGKGSSIKKAQQDAASNALKSDQVKHAFDLIGQNRKKGRAKKTNNSTTPAVELNVLAMKNGESVTFTVTDMSTAMEVENSISLAMREKTHSTLTNQSTYLACVTVFGRQFTGTGRSPQGARHSAAEKALIYYRSNNLPNSSSNCDPKNDSTVATSNDTSTMQSNQGKSPISLLHEYAVKNDLSMSFEVVSESGPDHLPSFLTKCTLGDHMVQASGTSKRLSRRNAAEKMLHLVQSFQSLNLQETNLTEQTSTGSGEANAAVGDVDSGYSSTEPHSEKDEDEEEGEEEEGEEEEEVFIEVKRGRKRNQQQQQHQQSQLLTEDQSSYENSSQFGGGDLKTIEISSENTTVEPSDDEDDGESYTTESTNSTMTTVNTVVDPVQRLGQYCKSYKGDIPKYRVIYERYVNQKRREFVMECTAKMPGPKGEIAYVLGVDSNPKMAKKRAAENMLRLLTTGKGIDEVKIPPKSNLAPILKDTTHCANQNTETENEIRPDRPRRQRQVSFSDSHNTRHKRGKKDN